MIYYPKEAINFIENREFNGFRRSLNNKNHGFKLVKKPHPVRAGELSQRFELRSGDCGEDHRWSDCDNDRSRIEFISNQGFAMGEEKWIAWSIFLDRTFEDVSPTKTTLGQIPQHDGPSGTAGGFPSTPPLIQFEIMNGDYVLVYHDLTGNRRNVVDNIKIFKLISLSEMINRWVDVILHIKFEKKEGFLEVFVNGTKCASIDKNLVRFKPKKFYFKYGIYNAFVSRYEKKFEKSLPTQIVYYDEVRVGNKREDVDLSINPNLSPID